MQDYDSVNRDLWNHRTRLHIGSAFYQEDDFREGKTTLNAIELDGLGDVANKKLLHLQCHYGLDSLSWVREGAVVTGVDYSEEAIAYAVKLSESVRVPATFICSNIYDLPKVLEGSFDIVFTSYGVLHWLSSLDQWARIIRDFLAPNGIFFMVEFHPLELLFDATGIINHDFHYSSSGKPLPRIVTGTYADPAATLEQPAWNWRYGLGEVITALARVGLRIESLVEYPFTYYWGKQREADTRQISLPRLYSIKARDPR